MRRKKAKKRAPISTPVSGIIVRRVAAENSDEMAATRTYLAVAEIIVQRPTHEMRRRAQTENKEVS